MKAFLENLVEVNDNTPSKIFDITIMVLIVLSVITFSIETLPHLGKTTRTLLHGFEVISVLIFTVEYLMRIYVAKKRLAYIFSFYGIIDLLAILPFYLSLYIDLRSIRIFRLFRLLRLLKLTRYSKTVERFKSAIIHSKEEFVLFFILTLFLFYLASVGIYFFEHKEQPDHFSSVFASMWWAVATLTTVGYGDVYPVTAGGKIFTSIILLLGLGIVAIPAGIISTALMQENATKKEDEEE